MYLFLLILIIKCISCNVNHINEINVGTALFTKADNSRQCWSNEQLALLRARLVFQDVLPKTHVITMADDKFVTELVNYFRMSIEKTKSLTNGKTRQINLMALTDTLGGFMRHIILPMAKHAFYTGKINYESIEQLSELYNDLKSFLKTDGSSWSLPGKYKGKIKRSVNSLKDIPNEYAKVPCKHLDYTESPNGAMTFPTPFLDSKTNPTAIALPFKEHPLRKLKSKTNSAILAKYYNTAIACMQEKNANQESINRFKDNLNEFIDLNVINILDSEEIYPAFGNIQQLKETVSKIDPTATAQSKQTNNLIIGLGDAKHNISMHNKSELPPGATTTELFDENDYYSDEDQTTTIMFAAVGVVILIWIVTGIIYCCCRLRHKNKENDKHIIDINDLPPNSEKSSSFRHTFANINRHSKLRVSQSQHRDSDIKPRTSLFHPENKEANTENNARVSIDATDSRRGSSNARLASGASVRHASLDAGILKSDNKAICMSKSDQENGEQCRKCKRIKCNRHVAFMLGPTKSAPVKLRAQKNKNMAQGEKLSSNNETESDKTVVFGYDFETTSSDSSSLDSTPSSSGPNTPKRI